MRIGFLARPTEDDFEFAALKSFPCVELNFFEDLSALERSNDIRHWSQKYGIDLSQVGLFGRNYLSDDAAERDAGLRALREVARYAQRIGAPVVTSGGGSHPALTLEQSCERVVERLGPVIAEIESQGLRFAFYNCHWANFVTHGEAWQPLLEALPGAGIKFDPSHPVYYGEDWRSQMAAWGSRIVHTHAKDVVMVQGKPFEDVPAGLGIIPWG
jgi:sugar phosphate isomerase/epimerase